jgi:methylthioribose-1-phosphate isomerase
MSCERRPQDYEDLRDSRPTAEELDWVVAHLERLVAEDLDARGFEYQFLITRKLRGGL